MAENSGALDPDKLELDPTSNPFIDGCVRNHMVHKA